MTPLANAHLVLENNRKKIYSANWGLAKDLKQKKLLVISDTEKEGCVTLKDLLIEKGEVSF